jgi:hypothetical protein
MYVNSGDLGGHLMKHLCQPITDGSLGRSLSTLCRDYDADFPYEKLQYTRKTLFPAGTPFCDTDASEQNAHWAVTCAAN